MTCTLFVRITEISNFIEKTCMKKVLDRQGEKLAKRTTNRTSVMSKTSAYNRSTCAQTPLSVSKICCAESVDHSLFMRQRHDSAVSHSS